MSERLKMSVDDLLKELAIIGTSSVDHFTVDGEGNIKVVEGLDPERIRAISSMSHTVTHLPGGKVQHQTKFKLWEKNPALAQMAKRYPLQDAQQAVDPELAVMSPEERDKRMLALLALALAKKQMAEHQQAKGITVIHHPPIKGEDDTDDDDEDVEPGQSQWFEVSPMVGEITPLVSD